MKEVLISIQPKWCELIASGKKTVEVRKTRPKIDTPFKCYIYCTLGHRRDWGDLISIDSPNQKFESYIGNGKVIGEFVCDKIINYDVITDYYGDTEYCEGTIAERHYANFKCACLTCEDVIEYGKGNPLFGWHFSDLKIYDKPKELREFYHYCGDFPYCDNCKYYHYENTESGNHSECCSPCEGCKPITRPPQSWCYVEGNKQ